MSQPENAPERKPRSWGSIRQRGGRFYVTFPAEGRKHERGPFSTWKTADKMRRRAQTLREAQTPIADILAGVFGDDTSTNTTFRATSESYLTSAATRKRASSLADDIYRLGVLCRAPWAGKRLSRVTVADLTTWAEGRLLPHKALRLRERRKGESVRVFRAASDRWELREVPGASTPTVNKDLHLVSAVYRWAMRLGLTDYNPVRGVAFLPVKNRERGIYLTSAECVALLDTCSSALRPIVQTALHTGMRRGELLGLAHRDLDFARCEILVRAETAKSGRGRVVPMTADLRTALAALPRPLPKIDGSDRVFVLADGVPVGRSWLRCCFEDAVLRCEGIPPAKRGALRFHDLRHTAASLMVAAGVPILDVARILGHSTLAVTMRYSHFAPESGRRAIDALGAALAEPATTTVTATK
jgi:integrase